MKKLMILLIMAGIPIIPATGGAVPRDIHVEWEEYGFNGDLAGFRLYHKGTPVCETSDPDAVSMDCRVDLPDGQTYFTLTAVFMNGLESAPSATFPYVFSALLKADFTADIIQGSSPLTVNFDASPSTGNIIGYTWSFGDGETGSGKQTSHTFMSAGLYIVTLQVTGESGAVDRETVNVTVTGPPPANVPPNAEITSSIAAGTVPMTVEFDASGSSDSDGRIISYRWAFGDGETAAGIEVTHTYLTTGSFTANLRVTDDGGLEDEASMPILVGEPPEEANIPPIAAISVFSLPRQGELTFIFNAGGSVDPDGTISGYSWNFGDGAAAWSSTAIHSYPAAGIYEVILKVTDNSGDISPPARFILDTEADIPELTRQALPFINLLLEETVNEDIP